MLPHLSHRSRRLAPLLIAALALLAWGAARGIDRAQAQRGPILSVEPAPGSQGVWPGNAIGLHFDRPVDRASVEAALSVEPAAAGRSVWRENWVQFLPAEPLAPRTRYTVTLGTGARDSGGRPLLTQPYSWSFEVQDWSGGLNFGWGVPVQLLAPSGSHGLGLNPPYPRMRVELALYALDAPGFARRYAALDPEHWDSGNPKPIEVGGLTQTATWSAPIDNTEQMQGIRLPKDTAPGLYVVEARHARAGTARALLVHSDKTIVAKQGRAGLGAWVTGLLDGQPAGSAALSMIDASGSVLAEATADADGVARFDGAPAGALIFARSGDQTTVVGLDQVWRVGYGWWRWWGGWWNSEAPDYAGHVHSDRPIYRPGHTVFYKASLRRFDGEGLAVLDATTPLTVTIRDAKGNTIAKSPARADDFGSIAGELALGEDVALGDWSIAVQAGAQTFEGRFEVQAYVKPDFEVTVTPDRPWYVRDETAEITVGARYYFGQPAAGATATLRVFRGYYYRGNGAVPTSTYEGVLGPDGTWKVTVPLAGNPDYAEQVTFEAEVVDASRRPVVGDAYSLVHPAAFALALTADSYGVEVGQPVDFSASTIDHAGQPVAGRRVDVEVHSYYWDEGSRTSGYRVVHRQSVSTGADGTAAIRVPDLKEGWYQVLATAADDAGRKVNAQSYAWLFREDYPWRWWGGLELTLDKPSYQPGETAQLLIKSPVTTTALVTVERDEVYETQVLPVSGGTTIALPIKPEYAPNAQVTVQLYKPSDYAWAGRESELLSASLNIVVPAEDKRLAVEIVPDAEPRAPGEEAAFTLKVRDAAGRPVDAQLSFALVDKAVLALAPDRSGDIFDAFWRDWQNAVKTYDSSQPGQSYRGGPEDAAGPPRAQPEPGGREGDQETTPPAPRRDFRDTAYWNAIIATGPDGDATVTLTLPDNLTTWVAVARAVTRGSEVGQGRAELLVTQPIIADPALPRFAVQGDQFALDVLARNYVGGTLGAACSLEAAGLTQLDPGPRDLELPFNETRFARWSVVASAVGAGTVKAELVTPAGGDRIELPFTIAPFTVPDRFVRHGATTERAEEAFELPFNAVPEASKVEIRLAPGVASGVLEGVEELIGYPYGCVEQTMSRVLPNAVVGRLGQKVPLEAPELLAELPKMMDLGLQKLYGFQNGDGSWGWWQGEGNLYTTAYVLQGLSLVREAGFAVDTGVLDRGFVWLGGAIGQESDPRLRAYAVYVMAAEGRPVDPSLTEPLYQDRAALDAFALGALALALADTGQAVKAEQVTNDLVARAKTGPTTAWWPLDIPEGKPWEPYHWRSMASAEKNTGMALMALSRLRPQDPLGPKAARWLLEQRWGRGWSSTQATAFAILGLTDHLLASGEMQADYGWSLRLDGREVASGRVTPGSATRPIPPVVLTGQDLGPGPHRLEIAKQGTGTLFYTVLGQMALYHEGFAPAAAEGQGLALARSYTPIQGRSDAEGWHVGDLVNVRLELETAEDLRYVIVEDLLPAGLEGLNESLDTETGRVPGSDPEPGRPGQMPPWRWWGYERKEVRDDRVTFFASYLPAGSHTFEYAARAITPGSFSARPAEAYAMYRPELWARSASARVEIDATKVARRPDLAGDFDRDCRLTGFDAALVAADWAAGRGRDLTGDGRVSVADIATAAGRAGKACGDTVPPRPGEAGALALSLGAPATVRQHEAFDLEIRLDGAGPVGAYELTLELPAGAFEVLALQAGERLPGARPLGLEVAADGRRVRVGGWAPAEGAAEGRVLARLRLKPLGQAPAAIGIAAAELVDGAGGAYRLSTGGTTVTPEAWEPSDRLWLPLAYQR